MKMQAKEVNLMMLEFHGVHYLSRFTSIRKFRK